jgi:hypothetical protein
MAHKITTFEGRSYYFDPDCDCGGCEGLRRNPTPSLCDWCNNTHCGDGQHCLPPNTDATSDNGFPRESPPADGSDDAWAEVLCSDINGRIKQITQYIKEQYGMPLPPPVNQGPEREGGSSNRNNGGRQRKNTGYPKLTNDLLSTVPNKVKVLAVKVGENPYQQGQKQLTVKAALNGQIVMWYLSLTNPIYAKLYEWYGSDENDYVDKTFLLFLEMDDFNGKMWQRVKQLPEMNGGSEQEAYTEPPVVAARRKK